MDEVFRIRPIRRQSRIGSASRVEQRWTKTWSVTHGSNRTPKTGIGRRRCSHPLPVEPAPTNSTRSRWMDVSRSSGDGAASIAPLSSPAPRPPPPQLPLQLLAPLPPPTSRPPAIPPTSTRSIQRSCLRALVLAFFAASAWPEDASVAADGQSLQPPAPCCLHYSLHRILLQCRIRPRHRRRPQLPLELGVFVFVSDAISNGQNGCFLFGR